MNGILVAALLGSSIAQARATPEPALSPDRMTAIRHLARQECGACHGLTFRGGLGSPLTPEALAGKPDESLVATMLSGRPGTPMPSWRPFLSEEEAKWLVYWLRQGALP
ncbi:c-type cytochrome [Laribacter hongkongensis]|uniref:c-type cytochrome n=1 Tax=Laribacter hongkongensis TaxID=168471 RepID=UPI0023D81483|nr:cytochrome c [Laribacter hongkongensis]